MTATQSDHSLWKEGSLILALLCNVVSLVALVSNSWAIPANKDFSPSFEGLGLWKYCRYREGHVDGDICYDTVSMDMAGIPIICSMKARLTKQYLFTHNCSVKLIAKLTNIVFHTF